MGEVYRAHDERLDRDVALKLLPQEMLQDEVARARLLREARAAAALNHPQICTIHEVGEADGQVYIAMELVEGHPLSQVIPRGGLPLERVLRFGVQIADALSHAHERQIVHRDLKSVNVIITPDGRSKVLDFGLARRLSTGDPMEATTQWEGTLTRPGSIVGTLAYMAPEQLRGEPADTRSDIWALGVVLYEMASGERPFHGRTEFELSSAVLGQKPVPLSARVPVELRTIIERCLEKEPGERYQRAGEVRALLEAVGGGDSRLFEPSLYRVIRRPWWMLVAVLALMAVALVVLSGGGVRERIFGSRAPKIDSLAVLPLENLSHDPGQEYFADGMTEALITELSKISALKVISRTSVMGYKGTDQHLPEIAKVLNVDGVIEGSVAREGDQVRITVQLIHGLTDHRLWGDSYQRELSGILALQGEVAQAIAEEIRIAVTPVEKVRLTSAGTVEPAAYELYVLGRHHWNQRTMRGYEQAIAAFQGAVELDPDFAPAYAALADSYMLLGEQGGLPQRRACSLADASIRRALEADSSAAEAHSSAGWWAVHCEWSWARAEQEFNRAIELNPGFAPARSRYGRFLGYLGRFEEGLRELERARELDPLSIPENAYLGQQYLFARRYDEAVGQFQRTLELDPDHPLVRHNLGEVYLARNQSVEAIEELQGAVELSGELSGVPSSHYLAILGCAYAGADRRQEALEILDELSERSRQSLVSAFDLAALYIFLGDSNEALAWLERGYEQKDVWFVELNAWPWFDSLRDDPRFQNLLQRIGFPH